jgi:hypothetical protein
VFAVVDAGKLAVLRPVGGTPAAGIVTIPTAGRREGYTSNANGSP